MMKYQIAKVKTKENILQ